MAIFLIKDRDSSNPDPLVDAGCYKLGDIVEIYEDDKPLIIPPAEPFYLIKIAGITKAQAEKYVYPEVDETNPIKPTILRRRLYKLSFDLIPNQVKNQIRNNRYYETTWAQVKQYIQNKVTLTTE